MGTEYVIRPAGDGDRDLIWTIQCEGIGAYVQEEFGVTADQHRARFRENAILDGYQIIAVDGVDAGTLSWRVRDNDVYLTNVVLRLDFQNRGIGTAIVRSILDDAGLRGLPVRLQVLRSNPARRLYARLGFELEAETDHHHEMVAYPPRVRP